MQPIAREIDLETES